MIFRTDDLINDTFLGIPNELLLKEIKENLKDNNTTPNKKQ